jgi:hypothetical protein
VRWWRGDVRTLRDAAEMPGDAVGRDGEALQPLPDHELDGGGFEMHEHDAPVVFGHYWRGRTSSICTAKTVCVDYSVAKGGDLVAYRWTPGEETLDERNLVFAS